MIWYLTDPLRFRSERRAIEELLGRVDWLSAADGWKIGENARITWEGEISAGGKTWSLSLRYPHHFPHSPPLVVPRGDKTRWSMHQWGPGGELCLEYGSDNWHPDITGADMLESAHRLLEGERPVEGSGGGIVASRHEVSLGQALRSDYFYLFGTDELKELLRRIPEGAVRSGTAISQLRAESCIYFVTSVTEDDETKWSQPGLPAPLKIETYGPQIALFRLSPTIKLPTSSFAEFRATLEAAGVALPDVSCCIAAQGEKVSAYYLNDSSDKVTRMAFIPPQAHKQRLDTDHGALAGRRIAIIGCGSLGSKIAAMLARAGVGAFLLVDDDMLFPDNLVRHDLDWREIGTHKVDSVARRMKLINPSADTSVRRHKLGGQESSGNLESLIEEFGKCDLLIDATAEPKVFGYICAAVATGNKPMVWAEVFGGGLGGLVARHRPGLEPSPASMRRIIESWCADRGRPADRATGRYEGGTPDAPLIADDADVTVIAAHAARLAIDMLIPRSPSAFPYSAYMIGLSKGAFFSQPFDTQPIEVGEPEARSEEEPDEVVKAEEKDYFVQLIKKFVDENSSDERDS